MYDIQKSFDASSVAQVLELMEQYPQAVLTAGGTDVLIRMKERKLRDAVLIRIAEIPALSGIRMESDGTIVVGPATRFTPLTHHPLVTEHLGALAHACGQIGSPQIRNVATIGGNICNGAVSADSIPSLLVYDAELELTSAQGVRCLPLAEFYAGPGRTHLRGGSELLTAIRIAPAGYQGRGAASIKFGQRNAMEIATLGCAVSVLTDDSAAVLEDIRIAFGVAAPTPVRCPQTEALLRHQPLSEELMRTMSRSLQQELTPRDSWRASERLRRQLITTLSRRTLQAALTQKGGKPGC